MTIKQISVFVENRNGTLADILTILAGENIDIRALSIADTTDYGVLRMIADEPEKAVKVLKANGITVSATDVLCIEIPDVPGGFSKAVKALGDKNIDIEYAYAFLSPKQRTAGAILRVEDNAAAEKALRENGITIVEQDEVFAK